jgi:activating signal cointegrator 1
MKALTLTQPWATLVAIGAKKIETRSWFTRYKGVLAIHAALGLNDLTEADLESYFTREPFASHLKAACYTKAIHLPRGAVVAIGFLDHCEEITARNTPKNPELAFGNYTPGRYAWFLEAMQKVQPVAVRGAQGLWQWNPIA